mmetsp:Transcript_39639/g.93386  ORF Transcript_39639/g.93386 Transcript_39639/m.93386 type:complete len:632 (-) Transcript_39639:107-2002(-)
MAPTRQAKGKPSSGGVIKEGSGLKKFFSQQQASKPAAAPAQQQEERAPQAQPATTEPAAGATQASQGQALAAVEAPSQAKSAAAGETQSQPLTTSSQAALSDEMKQRIEANRQKALEKRKRAKSGGNDSGAGPEVGQKASTKVVAGRTPSPPRSQGRSPDFAQPTPAKEPIPAARKLTVGSGAAPLAESTRFDMRHQEWLQYNDSYAARLAALSKPALDKAQDLWDGEIPPAGFLETMQALSVTGSEIVVVGILVKEMKSRPDLIAQVREGKFQPSGTETDVGSEAKLCSDDDKVWLEDNAVRMQLKVSPEQVKKLATGMVTCAKGTFLSDGTFNTTGLCCAGGALLSSQITDPHPPVLEQEGEMGPYIAFVSGLRIGAANTDAAPRKRLLDFLLGQTSDESRTALSAAVLRVVICGGCYPSSTLIEGQATILDEVDTLLAAIADRVPLDVMPGRNEPSNLSLPQMPLLQPFFPKAKASENFRSRSNPHEQSLLVDGDRTLHMLGHSGQPVQDIVRCTEGVTPVQALEMCLTASHLAPTAPDTLASQPCKDSDPFVMERRPDILFSGGHETEEHTFIGSVSQGTLCLCVPAFHRRPAIVLVNMRDTRIVKVVDFAEAEDSCMADGNASVAN